MKPRQRKGFTLIELLVVIAIIAILAAILFSVFAQAREKARQTTCLNNMKQLGVGMRLYMDDYDGIYPMSGLIGRPGWIFAIGDFKIDVTRGQIYPYVKTPKAYYCPSDPLEGQKRAKSPSFLSYSINGIFCTSSGENDPWKAMDQPLNEAAVPFPADSVLILEESIQSAGPQGGNSKRGGVNDGLIIPHAIGGADKVADFHSGGGNYVMGDTHAKWFRADSFAKGGANRKMFWLSPEKRALADQGKI
jgi:prepilin-type N-terminal cleavage/methylation domain-containing protein/prepilin-type processing-associated H-X9-DG protein